LVKLKSKLYLFKLRSIGMRSEGVFASNRMVKDKDALFG